MGKAIAIVLLGGVCLLGFEERTQWRYCRACGTDTHTLEYRLGPMSIWRSSETKPSLVLRDLLPADHAHEWMSGGSAFKSLLCTGIG